MFLRLALLSLLPAIPAHATEPEPLHTEVTIRHLTKNTWEAEYRFSRPIQVFRFERPANHFRRDQWKAGFGKFEVMGEWELLKFPKPTVAEKIFFKTWDDSLVKEYELFGKYSDGSVVLYTGHFEGHTVELNGGKVVAKSPHSTKYEFVPLKKERIIHNGIVLRPGKTAEWEPETGHDGTYVYFGRLRPLNTPLLTALLDPGIPNWIKKSTLSDLPKLFEFYNAKLKVALPFKPFVILGGSEFASPGFDGGGGTLPGLVQLTIRGNKWKNSSQEGREKYFRFIAHEVAHLWNGQVFDDSDQSMWMHEGGADAFAYRVMRETGVVTSQRYLELLSKALNNCFIQLNGGPVYKNAGRDEEYRTPYFCGSTVQLMVEMALKRVSPNYDLFKFWEELFMRAKKNKNFYTQEMYKDLLAERTDGGVADSIFRFVREAHAPADWIAAMSSLGIKTQRSSETPEDEHVDWSRRLLRELQKEDCGTTNFWRKANHYLLEPAADCKILKQPLKVTQVEGIAIPLKGTEAYDRVQSICNDAGKSVTLGDQRVKISLNCPKISKRPERFEIVSIP